MTEHMLAPQLEPGDIVIMDNLAAHKVQGVRQAIEAKGAGRRSRLPAPLERPVRAIRGRAAIIALSPADTASVNPVLAPMLETLARVADDGAAGSPAAATRPASDPANGRRP